MDSAPAGSNYANAKADWYADKNARVLRWWNGTVWSSHAAPLDTSPAPPRMQPGLVEHAPRLKWPALASVTVVLILMTLSLGAAFSGIGHIATGKSTQSTYIRLVLLLAVVAACAFFLYVKSRTRARRDSRGQEFGRRHHQRMSAIVAIAVVAAALGLAGIASTTTRDEASYQAGRENGEIQGRIYASLTSVSASDREIRGRCKTAAEITTVGRYWVGGYIPVADLNVDDFADGCFQTYRALAPK
ncbi:DUF2510 domain-containing protein [Rhodococcus erythropolis]|uniref:DUF2510 domain-containing protein n=1 Tax=Rhodococcus erythropolis TaxID=1833 RepID=UPI0037A83B18